MDFWRIIENTTASNEDMDSRAAALTDELIKHDATKVLEFCAEFDRKMDEAYTWDLWGVAYIINGGCGDDSFMDFRSSLISCGKEVFHKAIANAESLISLGRQQLEDLFDEGYLYAPTDAYEKLTGNQPETGVSRKDEPSGDEWEEADESLKNRFPVIWAEFGWEASETEQPPAVSKPWWKFW